MTNVTKNPPTGSVTGTVAEYAPAGVSQTRSLSLQIDGLRTQHDITGSQVRELQDEIRARDLSDRTLEKSKKSVSSLLEELTAGRGMGWSDIGEVLGVSVSAIRKWRKGGEASSTSRAGLARIAAFLDVLEEKGLVADPARWMELDLPLDVGHFIRPWDLYLDGHLEPLIDLAEQRRTAAQILDEVRPNWREGRSEYEVFNDADGHRSIRPRSD